MALFHSSAIVTTTAVDARTRDQITFPFSARPQAMTIYVQFVEMGSILTPNAFLFNIGGGAQPQLNVLSTGAVYRARHFNTANSTTATLAIAPNIGQHVELLVQVADIGAVTIFQSINGGVVSSDGPSGALVFAPTWAAQTITLNNAANGESFNGFNAFRRIEIKAGVKTMQEMRVRAGTD